MPPKNIGVAFALIKALRKARGFPQGMRRSQESSSWGMADDIEHAVIDHERIIEERQYHTIKEVKNGLGPAPLKTKKGWLHLASDVDRLLDYTINTPADPLRSYACVEQRNELIRRNLEILQQQKL